MNPTIQSRLDRCGTLPSLPGVAVKLVQLCQREDLKIGDLVNTLSADPALTAKVLKLVNSSVYSRRQEIRTLSQAVMMLGTMSLQSLALSFSLVPARTARQQASLQAFWRRSITSAIAGRELAVQLRYPAPEEAFLCCLLQDIGVLALLQLGGEEEVAVRTATSHAGLLPLERQAFDTDHAEVGKWLLERWKLPAVLCGAVGQSHAPHPVAPIDVAARPLTAEDLGQIAACASTLAELWLGEDVGAATEEARRLVHATFKLEGEGFEQLLARVAAAMPEVARLFEIDLGSPDDIAAVLNDAKEQLLLLTMQGFQQVQQAHQTINRLSDQTERLSEEASKDALTGLANRARLDRHLASQFDAALSSLAPLSVVMCDIDHFKAVNDTWGHQAGDEVLRAVGRVVGGCVRGTDVAGRYGGEEFMLILADTPSAGANLVAERLRDRIQALKLQVAGNQQLTLTASLGHATLTPGTFNAVADLVRAADTALYEAKRAGRNRTITWRPGS